MSIFFRKIVFYICFTFILTNIFLWFLLKNYPDYFITNIRDYLIVKEQYNRINVSKKRNIILGDSRTNTGVVVDILGNNYDNLAIPGSSFVEGYFTLRYLLKHQKLDTVILGYGFNYLLDGNYWFDERTIRISNQIVNFNDIRQINKLERKFSQGINGKLDSSMFNFETILFQTKRNLTFLRFPIMYRHNFFSNLENLVFRKKNRLDILKSVEFHNGNLFYPQQKTTKKNIVQENNLSISNKIIQSYHDSLFNLCIKNNIKLIWFIPPCLDNYPKNKIEKIIGGRYLFFEPLVLGNEYFSDNTHLNRKGAMIFSRYIKNNLSAGLN